MGGRDREILGTHKHKKSKNTYPWINDQKKLAELLDVSPQQLSSPGKTKPRIRQKKFLGQPVLFPSSEKKFLNDQLGELNKLRQKAQKEGNLSSLLFLDKEIKKLKNRLPGNN